MKKQLFILVIFLCVGAILKQADARQWNAGPQALAQEYVIINDQRSPNEIVLLFWMSPMLIPDGPNAVDVREMLREHLLLGAAYVRVDNQGRFIPTNAPTPTLKTMTGASIKSLDENGISPAVAATVTALQKVFGNILGPLGKGIEWNIFDGGPVSSCNSGGFIVAFKGTDYDYKTPIPGC